MNTAAFLLLIFGATFSWAGDDEGSWSKVDNGLRGRLIVLPPKEPSGPFYRVYLELQNTTNVMGQRAIPFDMKKITFRVSDKDGKILPVTLAGAYDGMSPRWLPTLLPMEGTIRFRISFPGMGYFPGGPPAIDLGPDATWIIPRDGMSYFLEGTLKIERDPQAHPLVTWYGTLELPGAEIPVVK